MNISEFWLFLMAAIALLGSPGPAIAALLAVGRTQGWAGGLGFYTGLQVGLATAAAISIAGLFSAISLFPAATSVMSAIATIYLAYLAYTIAFSAVGQAADDASTPSSPVAGLLLGITNPKAYLAFASLFASFQLIASNNEMDGLAKWMVVVAVMLAVDLLWLWIGVRLGRLNLSEPFERMLNFALGAAIIVAAVVALI